MKAFERKAIRIYLWIMVLLVLANIAFAQQDTTSRKFSDVVNFRGYLKDLRTLSFTDLDNVLTDNLIHNRLNFRFYLNDHFTLGLENRNRIFYGEAVKGNPNFSDVIDQENGLVDMSFVLLDKNSVVMHAFIDRLWLNYSQEKFDLRVGRQRINWGVNLAWNPNDLFNAYSFVDFDYEERPGSDAVRFQYYTGDFSSLEVAISPQEELDASVIAVMYKFNRWNYDFQILGGNYLTDYALGVGWAGNLKNAGFKGEATYFHPKANFGDTLSALSASISMDYAFKNSLYFNASVLLSTQGLTSQDPEALQRFYTTSSYKDTKLIADIPTGLSIANVKSDNTTVLDIVNISKNIINVQGKNRGRATVVSSECTGLLVNVKELIS